MRMPAPPMAPATDPDEGRLAHLIAAYEIARHRAEHADEGAAFAAAEPWRRAAEDALLRALHGRPVPFAFAGLTYKCSSIGPDPELLRGVAPAKGPHGKPIAVR